MFTLILLGPDGIIYCKHAHRAEREVIEAWKALPGDAKPPKANGRPKEAFIVNFPVQEGDPPHLEEVLGRRALAAILRVDPLTIGVRLRRLPPMTTEEAPALVYRGFSIRRKADILQAAAGNTRD